VPCVARVAQSVSSDVTDELRLGVPLLELLRELSPEALVALAGRPYEDAFLARAGRVEEIAPRVVRLRDVAS
jgi:hypothetical protein